MLTITNLKMKFFGFKVPGLNADNFSVSLI